MPDLTSAHTMLKAGPMTDPPGIDAWVPWSPREVATQFAALDVPWCVAGGWALDLWHGRMTREHEDIEIAMPRRHFATVRAALAGLELFVAGNSEVTYLPPSAPA